jgi:hypothetical protein
MRAPRKEGRKEVGLELSLLSSSLLWVAQGFGYLSGRVEGELCIIRSRNCRRT